MKTARMEFANGGQFPFPLLFDGTDATEIGGRSSPVGLFEDARYTGQSLPLPPAFALRLYSDGVLECFPAVDLAGKRELLRELSRNADLDAEALAHRIGLDAPAARPDDATVLSVRRLASGA
jgi:serine phosphatase RsbU (regulator of sigma subunit)